MAPGDRPAFGGVQNPSVRAPGGGRSPRSVVITATAVVVAAGLGFLVITQLSRTRSSDPGVTRFVVGDAEALAGPVERDGPLLFQDVSNGRRDVYVQHLGDGRWVTFEAFPRSSTRRCLLEWQREERRFVDPCDGTQYPADGAGLVAYPTEVDDDGRLVVDLRAPIEAASTSAVPENGPPPTGPQQTGPPPSGAAGSGPAG